MRPTAAHRTEIHRSKAAFPASVLPNVLYATVFFWLVLLLAGGWSTVAQAQNKKPFLTLDPTQIQGDGDALDGATITIVPKNSTFVGGGGGHGFELEDIAHPDDWDSEKGHLTEAAQVGEIRLNATGLAQITLQGAPAGLTISSGKLLPPEHPHSHGRATRGHRSAEITLAYTGSDISTDDTVTVAVEGTAYGLLSFGNQRAGYPQAASYTADFTIRAGAVTDGVIINRQALALTELSATGSEATYTVVLDTDPGVNVTITATVPGANTSDAWIKTADGSFGSSATLTFTPSRGGNWNQAQTVTVRALNDTDAANESFKLTHAVVVPTNTNHPYHGIQVPDITVTTTDAGHGVSVSDSTLSVEAGEQVATYTVVLKSQPSGNVVISTMSSMETTATASPATLPAFTASNWYTPQTVMVTGKEAGAATISHTVSSSADTANYPTGTSIPPVSVTVTDARPMVSFSTAVYSVNEPSTTTNVAVGLTLSSPRNSDTVVIVERTGGTATSGSDYTDTSGTWNTTIPANTMWGTVNIPILHDTADEPNETIAFRIRASSLPAEVVGSQNTATLTITDNDATSVALSGSGTVREGSSDSVDVTVTLGRALVENELVTAPLSITGPGINNKDYRIDLKSGDSHNQGVSLNRSDPYSPWNPAVVFEGSDLHTVRIATLEVTATDDYRDESTSETLTVDFGSGTKVVTSDLDRAPGTGTGTAGTTTSGSASVTITDDDDPPSLAVSPTTIEASSFASGGTATLRLTPGNSTFFAAGGNGGGGGGGGGNNPSKSYVNAADLVGGGIPTTQVRLSAAGLGNITLSGTPPGLTISAGRLLAVQTNVHGVERHRSVEIDLSYSGLPISADDTVTVTVDSKLLRFGDTTGDRPVDQSADFTINPPPVAPGISIMETGSPGATSVSEDGSGADTYDIVLNTRPTHNVTVTVTAGAGALVDGPDGGTSGTSTEILTFAPAGANLWSTAQTITVIGINDDIDNAGDERTVIIGHSADSTDTDYKISNAGSVSVTVTDDDTAGVTISPAAHTVAENGGTATYTVHLDSQPLTDVTITVGAGDGSVVRVDGPDSATAFTNTERLTFTTSNWSAAQQVRIEGQDDNAVNNPARTATIAHSIASPGDGDSDGYTPGTVIAGVNVILTDDDTAGVTVSPTAHTVAENGGTATYTVQLDSQPLTDVTITVGAGDGSVVRVDGPDNATAFTNTESLTFTTSNWGAAQQVRIEGQDDDAVNNPARTATIAHSIASPGDGDSDGYTPGTAIAGVNVILTDDDTSGVPALSVEDGQAHWSKGRLPVIIRLNPPSKSQVTVWVMPRESDPVSAREGVDWKGWGRFGSRITFRPGETERRLAVGLYNGNQNEDPKTFEVVISDPAGGAEILDGVGVMTIGTPDSIPAASFALAASNPAESAGTHSVTINVDPAPSDAITLAYTVAGNAAEGSGNDFTIANSGTVSVAASATTATIPVAIVDDAVDENDETVILMLTGGEGYTLGATKVHTITIADDDGTTAAPGVTVSAGMLGLTEGGSTGSYTVRLASTPSADVTVTASSSDADKVWVHGPGGTAGASTTLTFSPTAAANLWSTAQTVTITPRDDTDADDESVTISHVVSNTGGYAGVTASSVTVAVDDDETPATPTLSVAVSPISANEGDVGAKAYVTVTFGLDPVRVQPTSFKACLKSTGTASRGASADYRFVGATNDTPISLTNDCHTATIGANQASRQARLLIQGDGDVEPDETVVVELRDPPQGVVVSGSTGSATYTILNDDDPPATPVVSIAGGNAIVEGGTASFTLTATPAPSSEITVTVNVVDSGDFADSGQDGSRTVSIGTTGTGTLTVTTDDDNTDEPSGSLTATVGSGQNYTPSLTQGSASVTVSDDDPAPVACVSAQLQSDVEGYAGETGNGSSHVKRWTQVLAAFGTNNGETAMTAAEADQMSVQYQASRWDPVVEALECIESSTDPVITITGGNAITEGSNAVFTVHASPAPASSLTVTLTADDDATSDFLIQGDEGSHTVTIGGGQSSGTLTLATTPDSTDEPNGVVTARVESGTDYQVGNLNTATVAVNDDDLPATPVVSIAGGNAIVEGGTASFTLTATPAPSSEITVTVNVVDSGDFADSGQDGSKTVSIGTTGTGTLTVTTDDDNTDEPSGSLTATVGSGQNYTPSLTQGSASVTVSDDDPAPVACVSAQLQSDVEGYAGETGNGSSHVKRWTQVLAAFGTNNGETAMTAAEADQMSVQYQASRWDPVVEALECIESSTDPVITITGGNAITEGSNAVFTVHASPAPASSLTVTLTADDDATSDFLIQGDEGSHTVTIGGGQSSGTLTLATTPDSTDEPNGVVTARVESGTDYQVGNLNTATVAVNDDDLPATPVVSIAGGNAIVEGGTASFTLTATPAPSSAITVTINVVDSGDFADSGQDGSRTVSIGTTGTGTLTVTTDDDNTDEPSGSLTATVGSGQNYTPSPTQGSASVTVSDDDPAPVACVSAQLQSDVEGYAGETGNGPSHVKRWEQVLAAFGTNNGETAMTAAEAEQMSVQYQASRWDPVVEALECIESSTDPVITITGGNAIIEGSNAVFTVHASPAPSSAITVTVNVVDSGDFADSGQDGSRTVSIGTTGTGTLTVTTGDDNTDESNGLLTATVIDGNGYTVGSQRDSASVTVNDDDGPLPGTPVVSFTSALSSAGEAAGTRNVALNLNPSPASNITVRYNIGGTATEDSDFTIASSGSVQVAAGAGSATIVVAINDDSTDEPGETVELTLADTADYDLGTTRIHTLTITDNDGPPPATPEVSIAAGAGVTEGDPASFTVTANPAPAAPLTITLTVGQSGDYAAAGQTGSREVIVPTGGSVIVDIATVDDSTDEPDGSITATLAAGSGYTVAVSPDDTASVEVTDNDEAAGVPSLSVVDGEANESEGRLPVVIRLSPPSKNPVSVWVTLRESNPVSAQEGVDYRTWGRFGFKATFRPGETERRFAVAVINDSHDEDAETFEVVLSDPSGGAAISDGVGVMTIVNSDPMPAAWLARFGRTVAEQTLDGISGRMAASRTAGTRGSLAGQTLSFGNGGETDREDVLDRFGHNGFHVDPRNPDDGESRNLSRNDLLSGSSFTSTGEQDGSGGSLAFWGRGAQSNFDGREGTFSLDGETTTTMLGADYARDNWLVGLALTRSSGKGDYRDNGTGGPDCTNTDDRPPLCRGAVQEGNGKVKASLTAAIPYAAIQASERLKLWGALGHGSGEITLKPEPKPESDADAKSYKSDIDWTMMAVGGRSELLPLPREGSGPAMTLTGDALWARTESEKTTSLASSDSDVTRLRLGLEGSWRIATEGDGSITPKLELGVRQDGGDAETGSGMELGAGIAWRDPGLGLSLDLSGRTLVTHTDEDLENEGYSVSFQYDPRPASARGLALSLSQEIGGPSAGGLDALFAPEPLSERPDSDDDSRLKLEAAYGFPAFSGRYISSPGISFGRASGSRDYGLGWRFTPVKNASGISFGVKAVRRESEGASSKNAVGVEASLHW